MNAVFNLLGIKGKNQFFKRIRHSIIPRLPHIGGTAPSILLKKLQ